MWRRVGPWSVLVLALVAGCKAGTKHHGYLEVGQWTPDLEVSGRTKSESTSFDLVDEGGMESGDSFWTFDGSLQFTVAQSKRLGAHAFNLGYFNHRYKGSRDIPSAITFDGQQLLGNTTTSGEFTLYKFTYEEPSSGGGGERTAGLIGLHTLEYNIKATDSDSVSKLSGSAPMFVVGYKISYFSQNLMYFLNVEGMDLDAITLQNVKGGLLEYTAGVRWVFDDSSKMAISAGWRSYDADLEIKKDRLDFFMEGAFFSFFIQW